MNRHRLRRWREGRGLSQAALAQLWGLSTRTIRRYEKGHNPIPKHIEIMVNQSIALTTMRPPQKRSG